MSPTNKTDRHDIIEILLKVALDTTKQINKQTNKQTKIGFQNILIPVLVNFLEDSQTY
jgi:hypothetical protein